MILFYILKILFTIVLLYETIILTSITAGCLNRMEMDLRGIKGRGGDIQAYLLDEASFHLIAAIVLYPIITLLWRWLLWIWFF